MNTFSFGAPYLLALLPLGFAYLFYVYRKGGSPKPVIISSLLVLKQFEGKPISRRKFAPPLRILLELLLFLLIALGAARLAQQGDVQDVTLILDNSFGTKARMEGGKQVWDGIKGEALSYLSSLPSTARVRLFVTSPNSRALTDRPVSPQEASNLVTPLESTYGEDELELLLNKSLQNKSKASTVVFSDKELAVPHPTIQVRTVRNPAHSNVAIIDAAIAQEKLTATILTEGTAPVKTALQLDLFEGNERLRVGKTETKELELSPGTRIVVAFDIPKRTKGAKLSLPSLLPSRNVIVEDDVVWLNTSPGSKEIAVVSSTGGTLGLEHIPFITVRSERAEQYSSQSIAGGFIFHKFVPAELPTAPTLVVLPPPGNPLMPTVVEGGDVKAAQVTRWADSHPITRYLTLPSLTFREALPLRPLEWSKELISSTAGPIALVGEPSGEKVVGLGFEIFPFEGPRAPTVSILTLNIFKWLFDTSSAGAGIVKASVPLKLGQTVPKVEYVEGNESLTPAPDGSFLPSHPGLLLYKGGQMAVQFFSERESSLKFEPLRLPGKEEPAKAGAHSQHSLSSLLAGITLFIILLDLYLSWFLPRRKRQVTGASS